MDASSKFWKAYCREIKKFLRLVCTVDHNKTLKDISDIFPVP
jgi:hypothetical protein